MATRGTALLRDLMQEKLIGEDLFTRRDDETNQKRVEIMNALLGAGLNKAEVARLLRRNHATISYWTLPGFRERKLHRMRNYIRRKSK